MLFYTAPDERLIRCAELRNFRSTSLKTWIGGFRRSPEDWNEPRNWYPYGVPGKEDKVVVGGYNRHRCKISVAVGEVCSVAVLPQATLFIGKSGALKVDGYLADPLRVLGGSGISNAGTLHNMGLLSIQNSSYGGIRNGGCMINQGSVLVDGSVSQCPQAWGNFADLGTRQVIQTQ